MRDFTMLKRGEKGKHFSRIIEDLKSEELSQRLSDRWRRESRRVTAPAGSLLLWSSRTLHQGWSGGPRLAQPVCWEPVGRRSDRAFEKKLRLAALGLPSTHWASLGIPHTLVAPKPSPPSIARKTEDGIALPLKSTLSPATLREGVRVEDMWKLLESTDWERPLPPDARELLMRSIVPEILDAL